LERQAQGLIRAARSDNPELRAWLSRAAALCEWELIDPQPGEPLSAQLHVAVDSGGDHVARVAAPGVRRKDRSILCRARVQVAADRAGADAAASGAEEVELLAEEFSEENLPPRPNDAAPPPIDDRTPTQPLPEMVPAQPSPAIEVTRRLAVPNPPPAPVAEPPAAAAPAVEPQPAAASAPPVAPAPADEPQPVSAADAAVSPKATDAARAAPERQPGPPLVLGDGRELAASAVQPEPSSRVPEATPPATDGARKAAGTAANERRGDDALALAAEVVAAVETETDEDPEWAQLARGPEAFPAAPPPAAVPRRDGKDD
jgi:hypothetical protein